MLSTWMLAAVAAGLTAGAETQDNWHADYGKALAETKQDHQPLLVVLDIPSDETKRFDPSLLTAEGGALPLDNYALCHIDASTEYGQKVAAGFKVTSFPHVAIIDQSGSVILRRVAGEVSKDEWLSVLTKHQAGERTGQTRHTVAKPVISTVQPATTYTPSIQPAASYPSAQPYCPSCQLRNR